jgi:hypothetical protein
MARASSFLKRSMIGWLISIPVWLALVTIDHGKPRTFIETHFWLICFLPLLLIFFINFVRSYYFQYKQ